jgi:hypothetical protein
MVLLPGCQCCNSCPFTPIGLTSSGYFAADRDTNILLTEIHLTLATNPPASVSGYGQGLCSTPCPGDPPTYKRVGGQRLTSPSSGTYVLTKYVENAVFAGYTYQSESLRVIVIVYKQSYLCANVSPASQWNEIEISASVGSQLFYGGGDCTFGAVCYPVPTQEFLSSRPSDPSNSLVVTKRRVGPSSSYLVVGQRYNVEGVTFLGLPVSDSSSGGTYSGPITSMPSVVYHRVPFGYAPLFPGYQVGPTSASFYDFEITAMECFYSGGLPSRSAFVDE